MKFINSAQFNTGLDYFEDPKRKTALEEIERLTS